MSKRASRALFFAVAVVGAGSSASHAANLLSPSDFIIAIDRDPPGVNSSFPDTEGPGNVVDQNSGTKYLNFGKLETGFITTPSAPSVVKSFVLTTANDATERTPASYQLFGTNSPIVSTNNSGGSSEPWTLIQSGNLSLPDTFLTAGAPVDVNNNTSYTSYKLIFPTVKNAGTANSMQIADAQLYTATGGGGTGIFSAGIPTIAVANPTFQSRSPGAEIVSKAVDNDPTTKYLNFGRENSGVIVTPAAGKSVVTGIKITTANDSESRDPVSFEIYGTNDAIQSPADSQGTLENWTLITTGTLNPSIARQTESPLSTFTNTAQYRSYKVIFPTIRDNTAADADSMQISELQLDGTVVPVPEPTSAAVVLGAAAAGALLRRRRNG